MSTAVYYSIIIRFLASSVSKATSAVAAELGGRGGSCPSNNSSGGAWRGMEGHGGAWRGMDGAWLPKFNKYLRSTTGSTLVSES